MANKKAEFLASVRSLTKEELLTKITEEKTRLQKMTMAHAVNPIENPKQLGFIRKDIARLLTELKNR